MRLVARAKDVVIIGDGGQRVGKLVFLFGCSGRRGVAFDLINIVFWNVGGGLGLLGRSGGGSRLDGWGEIRWLLSQ